MQYFEYITNARIHNCITSYVGSSHICKPAIDWCCGYYKKILKVKQWMSAKHAIFWISHKCENSQLYYKPGVGVDVGSRVVAAGVIRKYYKKILKVKQ